MLKWLGILLLITGGTMTGAAAAACLKNRVQALSAMLAALEVLKGEICTLLTPLPEAISRLARMEQLEVYPLFRRLEALLPDLGAQSFSALWERAVIESSLPFSSEERHCLLQMGESLGRFDAQAQAVAISRCMDLLGQYLAEARQKAVGDGRLCQGLGLSGGVLLAVLLL